MRQRTTHGIECPYGVGLEHAAGCPQLVNRIFEPRPRTRRAARADGVARDNQLRLDLHACRVVRLARVREALSLRARRGERHFDGVHRVAQVAELLERVGALGTGSAIELRHGLSDRGARVSVGRTRGGLERFGSGFARVVAQALQSIQRVIESRCCGRHLLERFFGREQQTLCLTDRRHDAARGGRAARGRLRCQGVGTLEVAGGALGGVGGGAERCARVVAEQGIPLLRRFGEPLTRFGNARAESRESVGSG